MDKKFTVGQVLYYVPRGYGTPENVTITKIGRVWLSLSNGERCDFDLVVDSQYGSAPRCYLSKEIYEEGVALEKEWFQLRNELSSRMPAGMTREKISQARKIMGIV